jgi:Flp pilus assembly protein TadG
MALVLPLMILVVLGMFELGRGVMVTEVLAHAARAGARTGAISTGTTQLARDAVLTVLNDARIQGATVQVLVNGSATEVGNAKSGDQIQVIVTVPYANVSWIANPEYLKDRNLSGRCIMRRE